MNGRRRARALLSSYYGVNDGKDDKRETDEKDEMNIDSADFNSDRYVSHLLQYKSLEELVQRGNAMVSEIKSLDSDMQMLVYENYNKFISATDTIRAMKHRVEDMEGQMCQLEDNFGQICAVSDGINSSFSARRSQLEKLNGVKKNLTKLQFLMRLPHRLQQCVDDGQYDLAVKCYRKARRMLSAVAHVRSFEGISSESSLIMRRLSQLLTARLQGGAEVPAAELGGTVFLLLRLDGAEEALLKEYLARRRRALHERMASFTPATPKLNGLGSSADGTEVDDGEEGDGGDGGADEATEMEGLSAAASFIRQLAEAVVPELKQMHSAWHELFMTAAEADDKGAETASQPLSDEQKQQMLLDALIDVSTGLIEVCRRRLSEEQIDPEELLEGLRQMVEGLQPLHELEPSSRLLLKVTKSAEALAKSAIDTQLELLTSRLSITVTELSSAADGDGSRHDAAAERVHAALHSSVSLVSAHVQSALSETAPLLVPLCDLLNLRANGMAKHLVDGLFASLQALSRFALEPVLSGRAVLLRAGLCMHMASAGVAQVPALLKAQLAPHGLGGAALGFDQGAMQRAMGSARDTLLQRFVEMQAQQLSALVSARVQRTDWVLRPTPRAVTELVQGILSELRQMHLLAAQLYSGEVAKPVLPQGPFPALSSAMQLVQQRSRQGSRDSITKDLQRIFARKISFGAFSSNADGKATLSGMLAHVAKLALKTLLEEVRTNTFGRAGFQQIQVDLCMLRWALPAVVSEEEAVLALLDEVFISCQERCLDCMPLEQAVIEALCENERQRLLLSLA